MAADKEEQSAGSFSVGRFLNIFDYALGTMRRHFRKNLLVFSVFSFLVFLVSSYQLMTSALTEIGQRILASAPDITVQQMVAGRQGLIVNRQGDVLRKIFGVRTVSERVWGYYFDEGNGANYTVWGLDVSSPHLEMGQLPEPDYGAWPRADWSSKVVLGARVKDSLGLGQRRMFSLFRPDLSQASYEVTGLFDDRLDLLVGDTIFMANSDARDLFGITSDLSTELLVDVANPAEIANIAVKINDLLPGVRVITRNQILKTYRAVFTWRSGVGFICLLASLVSFGILALDKATGLSAEEVREVGILKILGWQTNDLILLRFCESFALASLSFLAGYLLAWVHILFFQGALFRPVLLGWSVLQPEFRLAPPFILEDLLLTIAFVVVPYLCATVIPAWRAATVPADSVI